MVREGLDDLASCCNIGPPYILKQLSDEEEDEDSEGQTYDQLEQAVSAAVSSLH